MFIPIFLYLPDRSFAIDHVIERNEARYCAVLYVYLDYKEQPSQADYRLLSCLLKQLVSQMDSIPSSIVKLYEICTARSLKPDYHTLLQQFMLCVDQLDRVYIFIDALDECDDAQQNQIVAFICELLTKKTFRIMVASRPHLKQLLVSLPKSTLILLQSKDVDCDVRTYLAAQLRGRRFLSEALKSKILETVGRQAQGM
jgi:ankyrin repeat domain-containing protein 50